LPVILSYLLLLSLEGLPRVLFKYFAPVLIAVVERRTPLLSMRVLSACVAFP
jgi:hypothetical protein